MHSTANRVKKVFKNADVDVIVLMNSDKEDSNFLYLTGFSSGVFEDQLLIISKKRMILPVSGLEYEIAKESAPKNMHVIRVDERKQINEILIQSLKNKTVGINGSFLPYRYFKYIKKTGKPKKIIDITNAFYSARSIKEPSEISNIRKANKIAKISLEMLKKELVLGYTEKQVAGRLEYLMRENDADGPAFTTIVSFDKNAALPHHTPDNTKLKPNSIVLIDFGAKYNNYCSDITRTFMFKEDRKSAKYKTFVEMHKIVKEAQIAAFKLIKEGAIGGNVNETAAACIEKAQNGKYKESSFNNIHSLGHAIGIDVHDQGPGLYRNGKDTLKANMVVSDEPGIYIIGFGGVRIEDDIVVTKKGAIML